MTEQLYMGNCLDYLKTLPDNSLDSLVTDPPYGLSKEPNITEVLTKWIQGETYTHNFKGFMGKEWDSFVPSPEIWKEVYRVLKPGSHGLVFAGTRTQDLMTISLRLAGFEVRDVIEWIYFSGFPKALDVGKKIDQKFGVEREVIGRNPNSRENCDKTNTLYESGTVGKTDFITAPSTEEAKQWEGWKSQLKPSHEPIILIRKPFKGSIVDNVLTYGVGALNVDGSRIEYTDEKDKEKNTNLAIKGRYPANSITEIADDFFSPYFNISPQELSKKASKKDRNSDYMGEQIDGETLEIKGDLPQEIKDRVIKELEEKGIKPIL